jgi:hypothetical protein
MTLNKKDSSFDYNLRLKDAGLVAATAAAQVGGSDKILDLGAARVDARVLAIITACEVDNGNELYTIQWQVSNSATFASGVFTVAALQVGDSSVTGSSADTAVPVTLELGVTNVYGGTAYRYARLRTVVAGTVATGINYSAHLVREA